MEHTWDLVKARAAIEARMTLATSLLYVVRLCRPTCWSELSADVLVTFPYYRGLKRRAGPWSIRRRMYKHLLKRGLRRYQSTPGAIRGVLDLSREPIDQ